MRAQFSILPYASGALQSLIGMNYAHDGDELTLIRNVISGDRNAFGALVSRHEQMIFSVIMRQVGDMELGEELTQETFIRAFKSLKQFRGDSKFSTWLTRIALNLTNSYFSSKRFRQKRSEVEFDPVRHESLDLEPEESEEQEALLTQLQHGLAELKPLYRDVLVLCALDGRSYEEAAEILEIPVGTVRSRLNKARLLLKDSFGAVEVAKRGGERR